MTSPTTPAATRRWPHGAQWPKLPTLPRPPRRQSAEPDSVGVEESIPLRVCVQLLASTGIIATDIAAGTWISLWAVPLSALGGWWSWRQRHKRNIATKFWLAFGMLTALGFFFSRLLAASNDTRLVLAEMLVQLQVLHSFDLPRRKNLGYSMMIGLVLLGVAGTVSQTLDFGVLLLIFLAIAMPTLILDYRSRLGMKPEPWRWRTPITGVSLADLSKFFILILIIGLCIFATLPRLPGYQFRTFPVSSTINFQGEFNGGNITNPGYIRPGEAGTKPGVAGQGSGGEGSGENTGYYGFGNTMDQRIGAMSPMKPQVVMRVRSQAPGFWRVLSFDRYTGHGWEVSRQKQVNYLNRDYWSYRFFLNPINPAVPTQEVVQTYTMVADLPNLVPVLPNAKTVYFPTRQIGLDPEETLRSPVILSKDLTYTVISDVPYRQLERLKNASTRYPRAITDHYLDIPPAIKLRLQTLASKWMAKANTPINNPYDASWFLAQALKQHYSLQPDFPELAAGQDLAMAFLDHQGGYPDHFATVLTLMLRSIGIPARLSAGFSSGQFNPFTGYYVVQNTDAHALTEVYIPQNGWFSFDPIPGHDVIPASVAENQTFGVLRQFWSWVAGWLPSPVRNGISGFFSGLVALLGQGLQGFLGLFSQGWSGIILGLTLAVAIGYGLWLSGQGWQRWQKWRWLRHLSPMEQIYQQLLQVLQQQGHPKSMAQTPLEWATQIQQSYPPTISQPILAIATAYVSWRYGDQMPNLDQLQAILHELKAQLKHPQVKASSTTFSGTVE